MMISTRRLAWRPAGLSTPSIVTLDNQPARMMVGQEIPVTTGEALSKNFDNAFRTVQRQNVGIQLEVKPQINAGGAIKRKDRVRGLDQSPCPHAPLMGLLILAVAVRFIGGRGDMCAVEVADNSAPFVIRVSSGVFIRLLMSVEP